LTRHRRRWGRRRGATTRDAAWITTDFPSNTTRQTADFSGNTAREATSLSRHTARETTDLSRDTSRNTAGRTGDLDPGCTVLARRQIVIIVRIIVFLALGLDFTQQVARLSWVHDRSLHHNESRFLVDDITVRVFAILSNGFTLSVDRLPWNLGVARDSAQHRVGDAVRW
jgi:hypothetical protein